MRCQAPLSSSSQSKRGCSSQARDSRLPGPGPIFGSVLKQACLSLGGAEEGPIVSPSPGQCLLPLTVRYDLNNPAKHAKLDFLNNLATGLVFIIVVVNIFITAFGVQKPTMDMAPRQ